MVGKRALWAERLPATEEKRTDGKTCWGPGEEKKSLGKGRQINAVSPVTPLAIRRQMDKARVKRLFAESRVQRGLSGIWGGGGCVRVCGCECERESERGSWWSKRRGQAKFINRQTD